MKSIKSGSHTIATVPSILCAAFQIVALVSFLILRFAFNWHIPEFVGTPAVLLPLIGVIYFSRDQTKRK